MQKYELAMTKVANEGPEGGSSLEGAKYRNGDRYWADDEHERFLEGIRLYGKNWSEIKKHVGTRSRESIYSHAQKFR